MEIESEFWLEFAVVFAVVFDVELQVVFVADWERVIGPTKWTRLMIAKASKNFSVAYTLVVPSLPDQRPSKSVCFS